MEFLNLLKSSNKITEEQVQKVIKFQQQFGGDSDAIVASLGLASEEDIAVALAKLSANTYVDFDNFDESVSNQSLNNVLKNCPLNIQFIQDKGGIPLRWEDNSIEILVADINHQDIAEYLQYEGVTVTYLVCSPTTYRNAEAKILEVKAIGFDEYFSDFDADVERLKELASETPIVSLVDSLILRSVKMGASDLHIEPYREGCRARIRVDGVLNELEVLPKSLFLPIVSRLKILANLDIAEKRRPQDGKIEFKLANQEFDIRISTLPLNEGESVVMRFLLKQSLNYDLERSGIENDLLALIREDLTRTSGVILLTGPTGSGKTTTLYSFLNQLNDDKVKIITLEDPVEYQLEGINQIQVNHDIGFDFSKGLRSIVRQDPDVIMVGEIRDSETAQIGMQSALTGHLVFSTLHTNDAPSAYTRLLDLGLDEYLLNAALISIVAQRLVRKICSECAYDCVDEKVVEEFKLKEIAEKFNNKKIVLRKGKGCKNCNHTGYSGRLAIIEYLRCDDDIEKLPKGADFVLGARTLMAKNNIRSLNRDGLLKVVKGLTTIEEVVRVAG
ncbi:hypothetical protein A9Q74_10525 [Colwellia sp. 39_35_sub15_T18]|mgnify:FL=1|nr:hypothetical protein A9Q74_10525 [Colwellia sp. 39_35_sub15_T18]